MATRKMKCLMTYVLASLCSFFSTSESQDYNHCGLRSMTTVRNRIIGGIQSRPGMWPWQVAIYKGGDGNKAKHFICGGALVDKKWAITTAHCFYKISETSSRIRYVDDSSSPNKYHVVAGDYNIFKKEENEQVRQVKNIRIFPGYRHAPYYENDIALVELNDTVMLGPFVRTLCIPEINEKVSLPGTVAKVAGWGRTTKSIRSPVLRHSAYQIKNDYLCDQATVYFFNRSVTFCAGSGMAGNDTCQGDSGGSLVRQVLHKGRQRWVTVGLVSWGEGCGMKGKYGYYTRIEPFVPWIQKTIKPEANCGNPGNIRNGRFTGKDFSEGSRVKYKCKRGFRLKGRSRRKCKQNGKWSRAPVCKKVQCPRLSSPSNGSRRPSKRTYSYRDRVRFSCKMNFTRIGKPVIVCQHDGTWTGFQAFCLAPCPDPGIPKGGNRLDHSFRHHNLVKFSCKRGKKMVGVRAIRCNKGRWNHGPPKCTAIECGRLPDPQDGEKIKETSLTFGGKVVFHCKKKGFELKGSRQRVCEDNGRWSGTRTTCEMVQCKDPGTLRNGVRRPDKNKYVYKDKIDFRCNTNHTLRGKQFIICQHNKTWSGTVPQCLGGCPRPKSPDSGDIYRNTLKSFYNHKDRVRFYCYRYYKLVGDEYSTCHDGVWTSDPPECKRICGNPGRPTNGGYRGSEFFEGREIAFYCQYGFDLIGSQSTRCLSSGRWSARRPECKRRCNYPRIPYNAATSNPRLTRGQRYKHGTAILFTCRTRYTVDGSPTIRCNDGRWSSSVPVCKAPCSDPGPLQYGQKYGSVFFHGNQVSYSCLGLFTLVGAARLTCADGRWDRTKPSCKSPCSDPGSPAKGYKRGADYRHGKSVSYTCQKGTRLVGRPSLTCNNGKWSSPLPSCLEKCPVLRTPKNGYIHGRKSEYLSGERAAFQCNSRSRRYDLVGNKEIICTKGVWSGEIPFCLGRCQVPNNLGYGVISSPLVRYGQWIKHGTKVSFSCRDDNKLLDGERQITCNDGTWSSPKFPTCKVPCSDPGPIRNGKRRSTNFTVEYECFQGYTLVGSSQRNCVGGRWSSSSPLCLSGCEVPDNFTGVHALPRVLPGQIVQHNSRITFSCLNNKTLNGSKETVCDKGKWSASFPKCEVSKTYCPDPGVPQGGHVTSLPTLDFPQGTTVTFACNDNYIPQGHQIIECQNEKWSHDIPKCLAPCKDPGIPSDGIRYDNAFQHDNQVRFACKSGYTIKGEAMIRCNDGKWNRDPPECLGTIRTLCHSFSIWDIFCDIK